MKTTTLLAALFTTQASLLGNVAAQAQAPAEAGPLDFLVQSLCLDAAGRPTATLPIDPTCTLRRLQRSDDPASYRKHDWPDVLGDPSAPRSYQASDSVVMQRGGRTLVVQTFDFGTNGRTFGTFDGGRGDGGQVALTLGDWSSFILTEDGGAGVQWFIGEGCRSAASSDRRFLSWLIFREPVASVWQDSVARLNIVPNINSCPPRFNDAYTRFRRDEVEFPFRVMGPMGAKEERHRLQVVVSEHYGGSDIATADHLERFFFARGLGMVRWELWSNRRVSRDRKPIPLAEAMARSARCPALAGYGAPAHDWIRFDCRTWTVIFPQDRPWSVDDYGWPALQAFGR
ncbi:hypothetical protein [Reyranella sp.]|uniref:hypothetical protein n=1 Tax=Reyranella sp. TaxID=1929291 RepID=UPI001209ED3F|nr:hypothetical protein [Reyranella sp.]TAJ82046.1 MAG: hypothetical protein EPO50_28365 [Reyranella sp.]